MYLFNQFLFYKWGCCPVAVDFSCAYSQAIIDVMKFYNDNIKDSNQEDPKKKAKYIGESSRELSIVT